MNTSFSDRISGQDHTDTGLDQLSASVMAPSIHDIALLWLKDPASALRVARRTEMIHRTHLPSPALADMFAVLVAELELRERAPKGADRVRQMFAKLIEPSNNEP